MTDLLANLALGFSTALTLHNVGLAFIVEPVGALIMLAGIYYGAQYGGSTTAILVNIPGEVTAIVTTLDGHQMARQGRAGVALGIAASGSVPKALAMILFGLLLSAVGTDLETGVERLTFGIPALTSGIDFAVLAMGVIGFSEVLKNLEAPEKRDATKQPIGRRRTMRARRARSFRCSRWGSRPTR